MRCSTLIGLVLALSACTGTQAPAPVASGPDISADAASARGLAYAQSACATCHAVEAGQTSSPNPRAPAFEIVANLPGMTPIALNAWLHSPHPSMPNIVVAPDDRDDIAAYLNSLKRGGGRG